MHGAYLVYALCNATKGIHLRKELIIMALPNVLPGDFVTIWEWSGKIVGIDFVKESGFVLVRLEISENSDGWPNYKSFRLTEFEFLQL